MIFLEVQDDNDDEKLIDGLPSEEDHKILLKKKSLLKLELANCLLALSN
jgi:hypothetical protein